MYIAAELVLKSYKPLKLEQGMFFVRKTENCYELFELTYNIRHDPETYMTNNGCPVGLSLWDVALKTMLADHDEIAWVDEGDDSEDMHEITIDDINIILANKHRCLIQIKDKLYEKEKMIIPVYDEEKVVIKLIEAKEE